MCDKSGYGVRKQTLLIASPASMATRGISVPLPVGPGGAQDGGPGTCPVHGPAEEANKQPGGSNSGSGLNTRWDGSVLGDFS